MQDENGKTSCSMLDKCIATWLGVRLPNEVHI